MSWLGLVMMLLSLGCTGSSADPEPQRARPPHPLELPEGVQVGEVFAKKMAGGGAKIVAELIGTGGEVVEFYSGPCFARLVAFDNRHLRGPLAWSDRRRDPWFCPDVARLHYLGPGEVDSLVYEIRTESLATWPPPQGTTLAVLLEVNGQAVLRLADSD